MCVGVCANARHSVSTAAVLLLGFCRGPHLDGGCGCFLSYYLCWECECAPFLKFFIARCSARSFLGSGSLVFLVPLFPVPPPYFVIIFVYSQCSKRVVEKKKREIPFVRQLLRCWHATALQLRQQPGNPHRAHYWWHAVNQWSLTEELENPSKDSKQGHQHDLGFPE